MKIIIYCILITLLVSSIGYCEIVNKVDSAKTSENSLNTTKNDTIYILGAQGNLPWYKEYGIFLGSLLSGLIAASIAIYSIYKTNKNREFNS